MKSFSVSHLSDSALLRDLAALIAQDHITTASMLAHLAEVDTRRLYLPAGYPSMFAWCVGELGLSEDAAAKRIQGARAARRFPTIFPAVADGRLHLAAVCLLAPHLTSDSASELIETATHKTKAQIERLLAEQFPQPDLATILTPIAAPIAARCPEHVHQHAPGHVQVPAAGTSPPLASPPPPPARITPLAPQRFGMQLTIDAETHELLRDVQALLGHTVPSGDLAAVMRESLRLAKKALEKQRFAETSNPKPGRRTKSARHIPARVRREVWKRDQGRCTFVSDSGHRCEAKTRLEFDHVTPVARNGETITDNLRLRCRAHNQYEAEQVFGEGFMRGKREAAYNQAADRRGKQRPAVIVT